MVTQHYLQKFSEVQFSDNLYLISDKFRTTISDNLLKHSSSQYLPLRTKLGLD